jgi:sulfonate transport system ATP-binding protein
MSFPLLSIKKLNKSFQRDQNNLTVLDGIHLDIEQGEFISIVGSSGCGKSTLLRLIAGLDPDYQGEILLNKIPIQGTDLKRGLIFQEHRLLPWLTVSENIHLALEETGLSRSEKCTCERAYRNCWTYWIRECLPSRIVWRYGAAGCHCTWVGQ